MGPIRGTKRQWCNCNNLQWTEGGNHDESAESFALTDKIQ